MSVRRYKRMISALLVLCLVLALALPAAAAGDAYKSWDQNNSAWSGRSISYPENSSYKMGPKGCFVVAMAKMLVHSGQQDPRSFDPNTCLDGLLANGMLSSTGGMNNRNNNNTFLPTYGPQLRYESSDSHGAWNQGQAVAEISQRINNQYYVIVCVNNRSSGNTHWIAVDRVENGDIYVMDNGGVVPLYGTSKYAGGIIDQIYFKYSGGLPYPAYAHKNAPPAADSGANSGGQGAGKTQYRYHRYADAAGNTSLCAYYGGWKFSSAMTIQYTDWMDQPLPVDNGSYNSYTHVRQGASCERAGCVDASQDTNRHRLDGSYWFYQETRTVAGDQPAAPAPIQTPAPTPAPTPVPTATPAPIPTLELPPLPTFAAQLWVTLNANGGTVSATQLTVTPGGNYTGLPTPVRDGYRFEGWYTDSGVRATEGGRVTAATDHTLYAEWAPLSANPAPAPSGGLPSQVFRPRYSYDSRFRDVSSSAWYYQNVVKVYELGLMNGMSATTFAPGGEMSIAAAITLASRIHKYYRTGSDSFPTTSPWYSAYLSYAADNGLLPRKYTSYDLPVCRIEFAYMMSSALPDGAMAPINSIAEGSIPDVHQGTAPAEAVYRLYRAGVTVGSDGQGNFRPYDNLTRSEAAAIVTRMVDENLRQLAFLFKR